MSCTSCKDETWRICLKFDRSQKSDIEFIDRTVVNLSRIMPDRSLVEIRQIVDFAVISQTSRIMDANRDIVTELSVKCAELGIPVFVKSNSTWK